jgi:hypothetical protein
MLKSVKRIIHYLRYVWVKDILAFAHIRECVMCGKYKYYAPYNLGLHCCMCKECLKIK